MSSGSSVFPTSGGSSGTVRSAASASDRSATSGIGAGVGDTSFGERLAAAEREVTSAEREVERALRRHERAGDDEAGRTEANSTSEASNEDQAADAAHDSASADRAGRARDGSSAERDADEATVDDADEDDDETSAAEGAVATTAPTVAPPPPTALSLESGAPTAVSGSRIAAALEALAASAQRGTGAAATTEKAPRTPSVDAGAATPTPFAVDGTSEVPTAAPQEPNAAEIVEATAHTDDAALPESRAEARTDHQALAPTANDGGEFDVHVASETRSNVDVTASNERAARVLDQVRLFVQPGMRRATLELTPANLGRIDVEISVDRGELAAHLRVDAIDTFEALQRHMPELRASLERAGLDVTQLELSFGARGDTASQQRGDERAFANEHGARRDSTFRNDEQRVPTWSRPNTIALDRVDTLA